MNYHMLSFMLGGAGYFLLEKYLVALVKLLKSASSHGKNDFVRKFDNLIPVASLEITTLFSKISTLSSIGNIMTEEGLQVCGVYAHMDSKTIYLKLGFGSRMNTLLEKLIASASGKKQNTMEFMMVRIVTAFDDKECLRLIRHLGFITDTRFQFPLLGAKFLLLETPINPVIPDRREIKYPIKGQRLIVLGKYNWWVDISREREFENLIIHYKASPDCKEENCCKNDKDNTSVIDKFEVYNNRLENERRINLVRTEMSMLKYEEDTFTFRKLTQDLYQWYASKFSYNGFNRILNLKDFYYFLTDPNRGTSTYISESIRWNTFGLVSDLKKDEKNKDKPDIIDLDNDDDKIKDVNNVTVKTEHIEEELDMVNPQVNFNSKSRDPVRRERTLILPSMYQYAGVRSALINAPDFAQSYRSDLSDTMFDGDQTIAAPDFDLRDDEEMSNLGNSSKFGGTATDEELAQQLEQIGIGEGERLSSRSTTPSIAESENPKTKVKKEK